GAGGAHGNALALQVGQRLDAGIAIGDDLDVVVVGGRHATQVLQRRIEARIGIAFVDIGHGVGQRDRELAAACLQEIHVFGRGLGDLGGGLGLGDVLVVDQIGRAS